MTSSVGDVVPVCTIQLFRELSSQLGTMTAQLDVFITCLRGGMMAECCELSMCGVVMFTKRYYDLYSF